MSRSSGLALPSRATRRLVLVAAWFKSYGTTDSLGVSSLARTLPGLVGGTALANEQVNAQSERDLLAVGEFRNRLVAYMNVVLDGGTGFS